MVTIMIKAIIYNSNTGFTKQYAYHFAISTNLPIYTISEAKKKLSKGDEIIYFSWIKNNKIVKLNKVKQYNIAYVGAVGMSFYSDELIESLKKDNSFNNIYYLQGGIRYRMLNTIDRIIMSFVRKSFKKNHKKHKLSSEGEIIYDRLNRGYENVDLNALGHLIEWYKDSINLVS